MALGLWPEESSPIDDVFQGEAAPRVAKLGPYACLGALEFSGGAVWDERTGFWSPAPGKTAQLRAELDEVLSENHPSFPYAEDARELLHCWPFWARFEQLAPGTCPIIPPERRSAVADWIERWRLTGKPEGTP